MIQDPQIRQMKLSDLATLHSACCEIYSQNFYHHWEEGGLEQYIKKVFGVHLLQRELAGKNIQYYMAFILQEPVAFMKLNLLSNLPGLNRQQGIELDKIYILPGFKGMKIGKKLLDLAFDIASVTGKEIFWLSVIDTNREAISFYEKAGFNFHSKTEVSYPKFKQELKGMWRMYVDMRKRKLPA